MIASSPVHAFRPDIILLAPGIADLIGDLPLSISEAEVEAATSGAVQQLTELWRLARTQLKASVIQQSFVYTGYPVFGALDATIPGAPRAIVQRLNAAVAAKAAEEGVAVLDLGPWIEAHGRDAWFDPIRWLSAKQLIAPTAAVFFGDLVARMMTARRGQSAKCLVLDLDNTLWGGVIGDDGLEGIVLGQGTGAGEAFCAFQSYARRLSERGVILAVCSKNDLATAEQAFAEHPDMVLKRADIAAFVANWRDKPGNLREIAAQLNIGVDSLVFFDDNPVERAIVRQTLPQVQVPEVPEEPTGFIRCLAEAGYFEAAAFTAEDRARAEQYRAGSARGELMGTATDMGSFLASLDMKLTVSRFNPLDLPRIVQLTGKTNQFNLTTRRHSTEAMAGFMHDPATIALSFRLTDRFGDNGLIAVAVAVPDVDGTFMIDTWLMSCRVLGREVEVETLRSLAEAARALGAERLSGQYLPTPKNTMVRDLYSRLGFTKVAKTEGHAVWELELSRWTPTATQIVVTGPGTRAFAQAAE